MNKLIEDLRGKLIVSCQAYPGEPMRDSRTMAQMAQAAVEGGAAAIRCQGLRDIELIKKSVDVPVIGLWKAGHEDVYITPGVNHALKCIEAGSDIVAIDATLRPRPDGSTFADTVKAIKGKTLIMADCSSIEDAKNAIDLGCDIVATTLAGNLPGDPQSDGPALELISEMKKIAGDVPVFCEGRVHTPADAKAAFEAGAFAVCVGTGITHPTSITRWFVNAI